MNEEMWRAIVHCDPAYDGSFYYGLHTTGIFCRPSCKSKTPKRENVSIFSTPDDARRAGLRPCKRCRPEENGWRSQEELLTQQAVEIMTQHYHQSLSLPELAARLFVSPFYLQRCFQRVMNLSPARFLLLQRLEKAMHLLRHTQDSITTIALKVGFQSSSHFSVVFRKETGCSPSAYRQCLESPQEKGVAHR